MASQTFDDTTTIHVCLNTATQGTTLNALGTGAYATSNSTGDLDNGTDLDLFGDFELDVTITAPADGDLIANLWMLPSVDDTNFPTAAASVDPPSIYHVGSFIASGTGTDQRMVIAGVPIFPRKMRFVLKNEDATSFSSDDNNKLNLKPYCLQS
jgi:hypothetical protein